MLGWCIFQAQEPRGIFGHSARNDPVKGSTKALSVGLVGQEKSKVTPFIQAYRSSSSLMNSGPLFTRTDSEQN